ncbi:response regulator, partial [bacterium]|nr:response regulator [bacterium]
MNTSVLCVDDEESMLAAYRRFLEPRYAVTTAAGGGEAIELMARSGPFAVVVSDLNMPGMDGNALLGALRESHPDTVRVLIAGQPDLEHALKAVNDGHVFRFLTKPCSPAAVRTAVADAIEQYELILSDRRRVADALRQSEERYRQLFEHNPYPMWVYDRETLGFLAVNAAAVRQYGYTRDEFLGMTTRNVSPDPPARAPVLSGHGTAVRHWLKSGEVRLVETAANPIEFGGRDAQQCSTTGTPTAVIRSRSTVPAAASDTA